MTAVDGGLDALRRHWDGLGRHDPMWAILSDPAKLGRAWEAAEFFATGRADIAALLHYIDHDLVPRGLRRRWGRALDFGCGLGRLSQALAAHFARVDGVDIAPSMVEQARQHDRSRGRVRYHVNGSTTLPFADASFDLVYSNIVLQHIPREPALAYIAEFVRVLVPGGLVIFSLPSRHLQAGEASHVSPVPSDEGVLEIEMNPIPRERVEDALRAAGARIVHVHDYPVAGPGYECFRYAATR